MRVLFQSRCHPSWSSFAAGFGTSAGIEHVQPLTPGKGCARMPASDKQRTVEVASREDAPGIVLWVQAGSKTHNMENPEAQVMRNT